MNLTENVPCGTCGVKAGESCVRIQGRLRGAKASRSHLWRIQESEARYVALLNAAVPRGGR